MKTVQSGRKKGWLWVSAGLILITSILLRYHYYNQQQVEEERLLSAQRNFNRLSSPLNKHYSDSCIGLLHSGDIVMRTGNDVTSYMLTQFNQKDKTYSHCGMVMIEDGYPFVYHSIGGEDNPDERMRRDSACIFISAARNLGFGVARFDLADKQQEELHAVVKKLYQRRPLFDMDFDLKTDNRLYCAEFIYKSLLEVTKDPNYIKTTSLLGLTFVGIDDLFLAPHAHIVWQVRYK